MKLLIATKNRHKVEEIRAIFSHPALELVSALDVPNLPDVEEDGATLEANAVKKASTLAGVSGMWALADDTGLEVEALGGAPGVHSARYAGPEQSGPANCAKLLGALAGQENRRARFRTVIALSDPHGAARCVDGSCDGIITEAARGHEGFGYDPLFQPDGHDQTFAEMAPEAKNRISHRARALAAASEAWAGMLAAAPERWA